MTKPQRTIKLRTSIIHELFPTNYIKMRYEDFTNLIAKHQNILTEEEIDDLLCQGSNSITWAEDMEDVNEFIVQKHKDYVRLIPLDNEVY